MQDVGAGGEFLELAGRDGQAVDDGLGGNGADGLAEVEGGRLVGGGREEGRGDGLERLSAADLISRDLAERARALRESALDDAGVGDSLDGRDGARGAEVGVDVGEAAWGDEEERVR